MPNMDAPFVSFFLPLTIPVFLQYLVVCLAVSNINRDKEALLAIKDKIRTDSASSLLKGNWSSRSNNVCEWIGITCSTHHRRVSGLNISSMGLQGQIAPQIGNLSFLISIDMSYNSFKGDMPEEMGRLHRLRYLNLLSNNFRGIPSWIGDLQNLEYLQMYGNQIKLPIPYSLFNISSLEYLSLGSNSIPGSLPANMCDNLPRLASLNLYDNKLEGQIPRSIGRCLALKMLTFEINHFSGFIPKDISNLTKLALLGLGSNMLTGSIPSGIFNMSSLQLLSLDDNELSGTLPIMRLTNLEELLISLNHLDGPIPPSISNSSKLRTIYLSDNNFSGPIPNSIGSLRYLERFMLWSNNFTNNESSELSIITSLTNCKHLLQLSLHNNSLGGTIPASIGNLSSSLVHLDLGEANLKGNIPKEIGNLKNLTSLQLSGNEFTGTLPSTIQNLQQLQALAFTRNKLSGSFPDIICKLPNLFILYMGSNKFSGPLPECLGDMASLGRININNNMFSSILPKSLWNLKYLLYLNISKNHFNETLNPEMTNMEALTTLDLSMNQFTGNIPSGVGKLLKLVSLSLAENKLEGPIPNLEFLNLSANYLSGVIPKSLESLDSLKYFNVSFNKLEGEIPSGGPFQNFTHESFMSNDGVCGGAPRLNLPSCPSNSSSPRPASRKRSKVFIIIFSPLALVALILFISVYVWRTKFRIRTPRTQPEPSVDPTFMRISYFELEQATNGFSESNLLGKGSFGSVYKATLTSGEIYAVKVFHMQHEGAYKSFDQECEVLRNIRHRNLVKVISSCVNLDFKSLVLQYMPNGSLENWLYGENYHLGFLERLNVMIDVAYALEHLHCGHSTPVVHCDLKPSNVLLDIEMVGYVADFGISKLLAEEETFIHTNTLATFGYMAPEYGMEGMVSTMCDVYSFGIVLMEVFTRKRPNNEMFNEDLNLRSWVASATKDNLIAIIDADILDEEEERLKKKLESVSSIIELALNCSEESPQARLNMIEIVSTLKRIKTRFLKN
ncbi:hypothetical protein LIER_28071 [Lithospermum erythrorhizon]|uniref:non-specific serine/threonine protein kinase n=1 Tax=Lithospermum erythrorhizon TaxID=34254 RepID=A0AAV3RHX3_LITER